MYGQMVNVDISTHWPINLSTNTRKIVKLCVDVCGYDCVNVNVADFASANGNVAGCVDVYEKNFCVYWQSQMIVL